MAGAREIKGRIKAVANIQRITKTMQMIATSKFAKAQQKAVEAKPFVEGVFELVQEVASTAGDIEHPLISGPSGVSAEELAKKPHVVLVITSDRGLCGPHHANLIRNAAAFRADFGYTKNATYVPALEEMEHMTVTAVNIPYTRMFWFNQFPRE